MINAIISSIRRIKSSQCRMISSVETLFYRAELDSHADTCTMNETALVLEYTDKMVDVGPFSNDYQPLEEIPIVKAALAYDDAATGETFTLLFGQALFFRSKIDHILLNPNQIRANGIEVDVVPRFLAPENKSSSHSIYFPEEKIRITLVLNGCISAFNVRTPTLYEVNNCTTLIVTDHEIERDPRSPYFLEQ